MIFIKLDTLDTINKLCHICEKYKEVMDIDIVHGRYTLDGASLLAVTSLLGNIVKIMPSDKKTDLHDIFYDEIKEIGAYKV